jgi:Rad3-related DNA helicase
MSSDSFAPIFEPRPNQRAAITAVSSLFKSGNKFVILDAPTGVGKTLIGERVMHLPKDGDKSGQSIYTCHSIALQNQFANDFPLIPILYGRSNYATEYAPDKTAADCLGQGCTYCSVCPYKVAKDQFINSPVGMTNIVYLLTELNYVGRLKPHTIVIDEADTLESVLMNFVSLQISEKILVRKYGCKLPTKKTVESAWIEWAESTENIIASELRRAEVQAIENPQNEAIAQEVQFLSGTLYKLRILNDSDMGIASGNWVYDGYNNGMVKFLPIVIAPLAHRFLWRHAERFLLMSATTISPPVMALSLGIENFESIALPSPFPVENRPIIYSPVASLSAKSPESDYDRLAKRIQQIMDEHPGRIVVHTVSYALADKLKHKILSLRITDDLERFLDKPGSVLLSPVVARGISLPYDLCEVVVIAKVPYMSLGDKQVSARLYTPGGQLWYTVHTVREIVQMTGRGMRSVDDKCTTYILDGQFGKLLDRRTNKRLFPSWWISALRKEYP